MKLGFNNSKGILLSKRSLGRHYGGYIYHLLVYYIYYLSSSMNSQLHKFSELTALIHKHYFLVSLLHLLQATTTPKN